MGIMEKIRTKIMERHQIFSVKRDIAKFAKDIGFSDKEVDEISIAVIELGENLIAHDTIEGEIIYSSFEEGKKKGIEIISIDKGPGIASIEAVMEDGYSSKKSLGIGLGAVKRMMSLLSIESTVQNLQTPINFRENLPGTKIIARKIIEPKEKEICRLSKKTTFSVFTRSKLGEIYNGDNYILKNFENRTLFGVIDGLGHGEGASTASNMARVSILEHFSEELDVIVELLHNKLRKTRGVALSLGLIDHELNIIKYVGIGNVLTRVFNTSAPIRPINYNGTLGVSLRKFKIYDYPWDQNNIIIMSSDGISSKYDLNDFLDVLYKHPMVIGQKIFKKFGKYYDDATILIGGPI